ncbi:MAG: hypothetical protein A3B70_06200 [Deltaproteobacteria bacterium RIFCSPHIGHO2_02_FULL_40_11]|nr:MAG: hypothetical protein A3B70_06200 [Deltaproteobacteria bacterium RIFCSPHIGHO2_02_FULL_40_11]
MSKVSISKTIDIPAKHFYAVVCDFEKYPEFISEITSAKTVSKKKEQVSFTLNLMKTFHYTLQFRTLENREVSWEMVESNLFKKNSGCWTLEPQNGKTKVTYTLDVEFGFFAPSMIVNAMVKKDMPRVVDRFETRSQALSKVK